MVNQLLNVDRSSSSRGREAFGRGDPLSGLPRPAEDAGLATTAGYTLIEILIVLFIISIVTSVALLSISRSQNHELATFTTELTQLLSLAEEQAMLQPAVLGLTIKNDALQFSSYRAIPEEKKNVWTPLVNSILTKQHIPDDVEIGINVANKKNTDDSDDEKKNSNPQIIISTNGDITPFSIYIGRKGEKPRYVIKGDTDGKISSKALS